MRVPWGSGRFARVLVYGMGLSGRAAARLLLDRGVAVLGADDRAVADLALGELAEDPRFELLAGSEALARLAGAHQGVPEDAGGAERALRERGPDARSDDARWEQIDGVVVSPGVPPGQPLLAAARRRGLPVIAEVELAYALLDDPPERPARVVAVTGTNGKSTTTALTGALLAAAGYAVEVCGNIGEPLSARVEGPPGRVFVVELSSFQIEGLHTFHARAAAFLNLTEDHLDRYADLAAYAAAKARLFANQREGDVAVLNADDPVTAALGARARRRFFSRRGPVADGCFVAGGAIVEAVPGRPERELFGVSEVPLAGVQNLENAMAAALLALAMGAERPALSAGLSRFAGLPHRMQRVAARGGVTFWDDSKGTNPAATAKSLEGFPDGTVHLILGGRNKGADLGSLAPLLSRKARRVYLIGEAAAELERALGAAAPLEQAGTLQRAVRAAAGRAAPGEAVVLSPACASFDQFRNFAHRGESFRAEVEAVLGAQESGGAGGARGAGGVTGAAAAGGAPGERADG